MRRCACSCARWSRTCARTVRAREPQSASGGGLHPPHWLRAQSAPAFHCVLDGTRESAPAGASSTSWLPQSTPQPRAMRAFGTKLRIVFTVELPVRRCESSSVSQHDRNRPKADAVSYGVSYSLRQPRADDPRH
jgi:hypothetical protein